MDDKEATVDTVQDHNGDLSDTEPETVERETTETVAVDYTEQLNAIIEVQTVTFGLLCVIAGLLLANLAISTFRRFV